MSLSGADPEPRRGRLPGRAGRWIGVLAVVAVVLAVIALVRPHRDVTAVQAAPAHADPSVRGIPVQTDIQACGAGWNGGQAGPVTFALWDPEAEGAEVYLLNAKTGQAYFDEEALGAGTTRSITVTLAPGRYRFYCLPQDAQGLSGPTVTVTGHYRGATTPGLVPVTNGILFKPVAKYHAWVAGRLPTLRRQVRALDADVRSGDLAAAKTSWLAGHMTYETLGAAYDAFGADNDAINAMPSTSVPAAKDKSLFGFHKIEALLWGGAPAAKIAPYTADLVKAVGRLSHDFSVNQFDTQDIGLRSHEILENALQFVLNGYDDAGSHTSLATLYANILGTYQAMRPIMGILRSREADLSTTERWLAKSKRLVRSYDHHGTWTPLQSLSRHQREVLDATISQTVEQLSQNATITEPRGNDK